MASDGGGWTLALKADGSQPTFVYDSALWTNADTVNPGVRQRGPLRDEVRGLRVGGLHERAPRLRGRRDEPRRGDPFSPRAVVAVGVRDGEFRGDQHQPGGQDNACLTSSANNSAGNSAACSPDNGDRDTRVFAYLFVR